MRIHVGCELTFEFPQETPLIAILNVHHWRVADLIGVETFNTSPAAQAFGYHDQFGNWCNRILAPAGVFSLSTNAIVNDTGYPDPIQLDAVQHSVQDLPDDTLVYLMGSRYCETDLLSDNAWQLFEQSPLGWPRVQAVCDYVHRHIQFGYEYSNPTRTAYGAFGEGRGVCRDYTHLAVALCRCLNIPTRYCTGYITDALVLYRPRMRRWIFVPGWKCFWVVSGTHSIRATTPLASDVSRSRTEGTLQMCR